MVPQRLVGSEMLFSGLPGQHPISPKPKGILVASRDPKLDRFPGRFYLKLSPSCLFRLIDRVVGWGSARKIAGQILGPFYRGQRLGA